MTKLQDPTDASEAPCPTCESKLARVSGKGPEFWRCEGDGHHEWVALWQPRSGSLVKGPPGLYLLERDPATGGPKKRAADPTTQP